MDFLKPLVLPVDLRDAERRDAVDLYYPDAEPAPAVLFVHGGPLPVQVSPRPRDWPIFRAYASLVASRGAVGVTVDHGLHSPADYPAADEDVRAAVELLRADPRVDGDRVALWFFSGGGMLSTGWLREPPSWLRCVALTYPLVESPEGWDVDPRFRPAEAVAGAGELPIVLTRVGLERPDVAAGVERFVSAAVKADLQVIDVPNGRHSFDNLDDADESRAAVTGAVDAVLAALTR
jgi:dienelactone hydrolase